MKRTSILGIAGLLTAGNLLAYPINITVSEGHPGNGASGSWANTSGTGQANADQRTMPGTMTGDAWDLEAFLQMPGTKLGVIGTFNLQNGYDYGGTHYYSGDIFFDTQGGVSADGLSGWEYVIHANWLNGTYDVYANPSAAELSTTTSVLASSPLSFQPSANDTVIASGTFAYSQDNTLGFLSDSPNANHNLAVFDIGFIGNGTSFNSHFTISCGNDLLAGSGRVTSGVEPSPVPDTGSNLLLLGLSLGAMLVARYRFGAKSIKP